ncbi:MAG TPA: uracil-DNA glycosylase [Vicinamibacteria bacterium]
MGEREDVLADLRERARYYSTLTSLGLPPSPAVSAAAPSSRPAKVGAEASVSSVVVAAGPSGRVPSSMPAAVVPGLGHVAAATAGLPAPPSDGITDLDGVRAWIGDCRRCKLAGGRKNIVFGQGNPKASLMFVGEGPGADEDEQGLAFVGRAGQLLTDIIEKGLKMPRADVFIANVIKCRPPQNRNPEPDEILACQPFLERQIDIIRPKVLVGLGKFAGQWLLKTAEPISRIRGRVGEYRGIKAVPTWHPAYLLRTPSAKKDVWEDMKLVMRLLAE